LPGLEAVEPDQHALGREERGLAHLLGPEDRVLRGPDRARMIHDISFPWDPALGDRGRGAGAFLRVRARPQAPPYTAAMPRSLADFVREALESVEEVSPEELWRLLALPDRGGVEILDVREAD